MSLKQKLLEVPPNKRMQSDRFKHYALSAAADARRYAAFHVVTRNGMGYNLVHDSELQTQGIGEVLR